MTYLVKNDSENSDYSTKAIATDFLMWIQPLPKVNYSEFTLILLSFIKRSVSRPRSFSRGCRHG